MQTRTFLPVLLAAMWMLAAAGHASGPRFFSDDPLWTDPETQDASGVRPVPFSEPYDFVASSFLGAGERADVRAVNTNTLDEVPDSSWFTNRIGRRPWTAEQLTRGPDTGTGPARGPWTIVASKTEGIMPGMTIRDETGQVYFIKFDPPSNPEMASGAEMISTKFFHAFGYHVPENYIAWLHPGALRIDRAAQVTDPGGRRRPMEQRDVDALLLRAARHENGLYRVLASRALDGRPLGPFRYYGTRPDDPNDIFPHEHRRELRGLVVFAAWLNHDEATSGNTLDTLVQHDGRSVVRHHLIDFGATLGSGSVQASARRAGNEHVWESRPTLLTMLTLGFYVRPWLKVRYPDLPAVGRFEAAYFRPRDWKPEQPNPAFRNARPEDRFWAARLVAALPDEAVRVIVASAQFSDPRATDYLTETILARKSKVLRAWLNDTNPIVEPALSPDGRLGFENIAEETGVAKPAEYYTVRWAIFDNATGTEEPVSEEERVTGTEARAPATLIAAAPAYVAAELRAFHPEHPAWSQPLKVYFRRGPDGGWSLVGLRRHS